MSTRELPVLNLSPFRKYPTKSENQEFTNPRDVCNNCLSGVCCLNQDAIALSSFDIFRLSAFFDMSPAEFMKTFTQDAFAGDQDREFRRKWNNDPKSSVITWLRRRSNQPASACIFLKYIREADGTPHRVCSVHDARPLSCREYYFSHCNTRGTGELASLLAEGFEKVRDGEITEEMVDARLASFGAHDFTKSTFAKNMEYSFWVEMKCVLNLDQANIEGANSYDLADYQDPIDEKLNRALSARYLRSEESYGLKARDEQMMPYTSGTGFVGSPDYERIMSLIKTPPSSGLFQPGTYPNFVGLRTLFPGAKYSDFFNTIPEAEISAFLDGLPHVLLFNQHPQASVRATTLREVYGSVLKAYNYLIRFASHIATLDPILECDPAGTLESQLFQMLIEFESSLNPYIAHNQYLQPVKHHMANSALALLEQTVSAAETHEELFDCVRSLTGLRASVSTLPGELAIRIGAVDKLLDSKLRKTRLSLYVLDANPIALRHAAGKRLDVNGARQAWSLWYTQVLDMRHAVEAGFHPVKLESFYSRTAKELEKIPCRKSYATSLLDILKYLSQSMTFDDRIACQTMPYSAVAGELSSYGRKLLGMLGEEYIQEGDSETLADFLSACRGFGLDYNRDEFAGSIVRRILDEQLENGSWATDLDSADEPEEQAEFLEMMYRPTWACVNALRPRWSDLLTPANKMLGLV
jgi:Fe-S-cluster containining protein